MNIRHAAVALALFSAVALPGCGKIKNPFAKKQGTPPPAAAVTQEPGGGPVPPPPTKNPELVSNASTPVAAGAVATPAPAPAVPIDRNAQVVVLCYHRLEGKAGGAYSIEPALFEKHMQELKDMGIGVISMQDLLQWRAGKKNIPPKAAMITIDDGYASGMEVGLPILKKYGYPATFFVYTNYINSGGKSLTWAQLEELRDGGYEIGSHTVSHADLRSMPRKGSKFATYEEWLKNELLGSKQLLEEHLGIKVAAIAYPGGFSSPKVHDETKAAGYELAFTTYGHRIGIAAAPFSIGRYDVTAKDAQGHDGFTAAVSFQGPVAGSDSTIAQDAVAMMLTEPMNNAVVNDQKPRIQANLSSLGALDPGSVIMRIGGLGIVPAQYDAKSKMITYTPADKLRPGAVTVIVSGKAGGQPVETKWSFKVDPNASATGDSAALSDLPPRKQ
jgi:peptidoglycan/xylan/chitin deacetylase (PgdA/CDA1 family)